MAKSKPVPGNGAKKPVFTPGILRHVASYQRWKNEAAKATRTAKKNKKASQTPAKGKAKKDKTPTHPLALSFSSMVSNRIIP